MNKEFIPYEQAIELKQLGFNEDCFRFYCEKYSTDPKTGGDIKTGEIYLTDNPIKLKVIKCSAPTFSQAFRFFREKYGLHSWITMELGNKTTFCWVLSGEHTSTQYAAYFNTYEEAELACLIKLIEIVKEGAI